MSGVMWGYVKITLMWLHCREDERSSVSLICRSSVSELCDLMVTRRLTFVHKIKSLLHDAFLCFSVFLHSDHLPYPIHQVVFSVLAAVLKG